MLLPETCFAQFDCILYIVMATLRECHPRRRPRLGNPAAAAPPPSTWHCSPSPVPLPAVVSYQHATRQSVMGATAEVDALSRKLSELLGQHPEVSPLQPNVRRSRSTRTRAAV